MGQSSQSLNLQLFSYQPRSVSTITLGSPQRAVIEQKNSCTTVLWYVLTEEKRWHALICKRGVISLGSHLHLHMLSCAVSLPTMPGCRYPVITPSPSVSQRTVPKFNLTLTYKHIRTSNSHRISIQAH